MKAAADMQGLRVEGLHQQNKSEDYERGSGDKRDLVASGSLKKKNSRTDTWPRAGLGSSQSKLELAVTAARKRSSGRSPEGFQTMDRMSKKLEDTRLWKDGLCFFSQ